MVGGGGTAQGWDGVVSHTLQDQSPLFLYVPSYCICVYIKTYKQIGRRVMRTCFVGFMWGFEVSWNVMCCIGNVRSLFVIRMEARLRVV